MLFCKGSVLETVATAHLWIQKSQSRAHKGWRRAAYFRYKSWSDLCLLCFNSRSSIVALVCLSASIGSQSPLICSKPGGPLYRSQISDRSSSILGLWNWSNIDYETAVFSSYRHTHTAYVFYIYIYIYTLCVCVCVCGVCVWCCGVCVGVCVWCVFMWFMRTQICIMTWGMT